MAFNGGSIFIGFEADVQIIKSTFKNDEALS
jgi:hypothetical protein